MIRKQPNSLLVEEGKTNDFSTFFREAPKEAKEKLLLEVIREANQDQREIVERYNAMQAKSVN